MAGKKKRNETLKAVDIVNALSVVTKEKNININLVLDSLKDALISAARKYLKRNRRIEIDIDKETGVIKAYVVLTVVEDVEDPDTEISLEDAKKVDPNLEVGDEIVEELDIDAFGRNAIQTAKQTIMQRVREHERKKIYADYSERIGDLVTGTIQQIDKGDILINLGRTEALLPAKEQIKKERFRQGDTIKACIIDVKDVAKGPQVIVSRTTPVFVERLFEIEVPEIFEGIVKVVRVARAPGYRSKVGVISTDPRVDPVGACVGMRGNRIQAIVRELSNEKMDIVHWTDEINLLVRRVFSPYEIKKVIPVDDKKIVVVVNDADLGQAIGKEGINIKLASKFLDKKIDIFGEEEFEYMSDEDKEEILSPDTDDEYEEQVDSENYENEESDSGEDELEDSNSVDEMEDGSGFDIDDEEEDDSEVSKIVEDAVEDDVEDELIIDEDDEKK